MNCWEHMNCGRATGGDRVEELGICPAYPNFGRQCARVAGTFCGGKVQGMFATKLASCMMCDFYNSENYDRKYVDSGKIRA